MAFNDKKYLDLSGLQLYDENIKDYVDTHIGPASVAWDQEQESGTKIAEIRINGVSQNVYAPTPPNELADLADDSTHRLVTDTEKSTWNNKSDFDGAYDSLTGKPTLGTAAAKDVAASGDASTTQVVMGNDSRLTDSRPASDVSSWAKASTKPSYTASEVGAIATTAKGAANGVAELDSNGLVPASQLPSYVDDVLEFSSKSAFPSTGETGKIYVATDTNLTYRWSGTAYVEISPSLALGETSSTAYRGDRGKVAYDHSQSTHARTDATAVAASTTNGNIKINGTETTVYTHPGSGTNPHGTTKSDVGLGNVGNFKAVSTVASQGLTDTEKSNARANIGAGTSSLIIGTTSTTAAAGNHTHGVVSTSANGFAPKVTDTSKFLKGDGTWATPTDTNNRKSFYGTCDTAAGTAAKEITLADATGWELKAGTIVGVKFINSNTASDVTLNVNGTGAKSIWFNNAVYAGTSSHVCGYANRTTFYMYDGSTYWVWLNMGTLDGNTNTIPQAQCETAASTAAKAASMTYYTATAKSYLMVNIRYANTAASAITLNVNSTGAKPIYINGSASSASNYTLPAGSYLVYYDGTNYYFRTDGKITGNITGDAATVNGKTVAVNVPSDAKFTDTTYGVVSSSANGLAPKVTDTSKFLKGDGTWATPTDTNNAVTQTATTTNANYEVLFSVTADNTTRTEGARKNSNLKFNPSTGNLQATQLNGVAIGSSPKFTDTTYTAATAAPGKVASASAQGSSTNYARQDHTHGIDLATGDSNGQVKIAGTNVSVKGLGSAAYKNESGTWAINVSGSSASCTGNAATATKLATARSIALGNDFQGSANFDGSGNITISGQNYNAACNSGNKANYPWHRIATVNIGTGTYNDKNAILCIQSTYDGGRFGIIKISTRTNASGGACSCSARWLVRQVFAVDDLYIALWGTTGQDVYADVFLKCGEYTRTVVYQMFGNRQFTLVASNEVNNTTASDKLTSVEVYKDIATAATEIHSKAYTSTVAAVDTGNVNYANNSGTVNGKTVAVNVPSDAKFTDTTYGVVSSSANGLAPKVTDTSKFLKGDGTWATPTDTNNAVTQTATTTNANYEVLFSVTADNTTRTEGARKNSNLKFNPSTGNLQATQLNGVAIGSSPKFTDNDTKNTAGSTDSSSKLFLIGATSQAANPQTYSHDTAYVGTDGCLYSGGTKVLTAHQDISGKLDKSGGTMTGQLKTSFNSSVAMGSYGAAATTIPNLCTELRYSSGCCGSFNLGTAYTLNNVTLAKGWYNFLWIPHRSGGNSGAADGDNCNYGCMYITGMTVAGSYVLRYSNSAIADLYNLHPDRVIYSGSVSAAVNATTCTINDGAITTSSMIEPFSSNSKGNVITVTKMVVTAGKVVLTFPALSDATSFKVRITNV